VQTYVLRNGGKVRKRKKATAKAKAQRQAASSADNQEAWMTSPPSPDTLENVSEVQKPRWVDLFDDEDLQCEDPN
jgi:hypothetical protein